MTEEKKLRAYLKEKGLDTAEESLAIIVAAAFEAAAYAIKKGSNVFAKTIGLPLLAMVKPFAMKAIDKLDGEDDKR